MNKILSLFTQAINKYLALDPESKQRLKKLDGSIITIELLPFHFVFQCVVHEAGVTMETDDLLQAKTTIKGTPLQMAGAMLAGDNRQQFFADDLTIEGDADVAQQMINLFDNLHIDWEEYLSHVVGDVPAYHVGQIVGRLREWLTDTKENLTKDMAEFIHEEAEWLPTHEALQDFFAEIDSLRMDVDRAEEKTKHLQELTK